MRSNIYIILLVSTMVASLSLGFLLPECEGAVADGIDYLSLEIDSGIRNHYAITEFSASLKNTGTNDRECIFRMEVPDGGMLTNFSLETVGVIHYADVATKEEAQERYDDAKDENKTASQVISSSPNEFVFQINIAPGRLVNISIRYEQVIYKVLGRYDFSLPFDSIGGYTNFNEVDGRLSITGIGDLKDFDSSGSTVSPTESWDGNRTVILDHSSSSLNEGDLIKVSYSEDSPPVEGDLKVHVSNDNGYFMHVFSPEIEDLGTYLPKNIIFILDKSGSMEGEKISQMKDAFNEVVDQLHAEDRFDLLTFSSEVEPWKGEIVDATADNKESAKDFISFISATGSTNIVDALTDGLDQMEHQEDRVPVLVFLTDGQPTAGHTQDPEGIRRGVKQLNKERTSIYSLGFGTDLDFDFIKALSLENNGFAIAIPEGQDASSLMTGFYDTISTPLVKDLHFDYSGMTYDVIPTRLPSLYQGSEAVIVGRFDPDSETIESNVSGFTSEGMRYWEKSFDIETEEDNSFIERLWAHRVIMRTLDDIVVEGETDALVDKVTSLALNYSFVTPYTSFILVVDEDEDDTEELTGEGDDQARKGDEDDQSNYSPPTPGYSPGDSNGIDDDPRGGSGNWGDLEESEDHNFMDYSIIPLIIAIILILSIIGVVIYTRLKEDDLLKQKNRKKIYDHIMNNPGDHFREIQRAVDLEVGTLSHHLNILEKEQLIVSEQDGNNRLFWVAGVKRDTGKIRLSRIQENILKEIQKEPGITQVQIAKKIGVSRKVVFYHVKFLTKAQMVMEEKVKRRAHYYPTD
jgi:predicted transcriptional regulator/uncharacterized protein YegL